MWTMDDEFLVSNIRKRLIKEFRAKGKTEEEIKQIMAICDKEYKENHTPYPEPEKNSY